MMNTNKESAQQAISRRLKAIARRAAGLPVDARSPRPTPPTGLLSLETMAEMVAKAEGGRS
jgi:hypothetical protein